MKKNRDQKITLHSVTYKHDPQAAQEWKRAFLEIVHNKMYKAYSASRKDNHNLEP